MSNFFDVKQRNILNFIMILGLLFSIIIFPVIVFSAPEIVPEKSTIEKPSGTVYLMFYKDGYPKSIAENLSSLLSKSGVESIEKATFEQKAKVIIEAIIQGPSEELKKEGYKGLFPENTEMVTIDIEKSKIVVKLALDRHFLDKEMDQLFIEDILKYFVYPLQEAIDESISLSILARYKDDPNSEFKLLPEYLPKLPPVPQKESELKEISYKDNTEAGQTPFSGQGQPSGTLNGKSVFISQGHGWYYSTGLGRWDTQRFNNYNILEDFSNGEACSNWLTKYLWNAGAGVYTCRERDLNTNMVIVDNGDVAGYSETGSWTTESSTDAYNGSHRKATTVTGSASATATFTPNIPFAGYYAVYVWYRWAVSGTTTTDARITINHTGGSTLWTQNQTQDGFTWKYVGTYYFNVGSNPSTGSVVINNQSSIAGRVVIADAVRFGGGMGDIQRYGVISNEPRWEECCRYYAEFMGAPSDVYDYSTTDNNDDVNARSRYAKWESENWEDSIFVSWHTNGFDGTDRGTSSFAYASGGWDSPFNGVAGSLELRDFVHNELINDFRAGWEAGWADVGLHTNWYGELNPSNNDEMPSALFEMAFHDNVDDTNSLKDPRFRQICARAVYQGIVKYFADASGNANGVIDGGEVVNLLPEPPINFRAILNGSGGITLSWSAPPYNTGNNLLGDAATGYRIYQSTNGKGFANAITTANTTYTISVGLTPGTVYYFRISATNAGGESFPTETLAVRYKASGSNPILIVSGFDRLDRWCMIIEDDPYDLDPLHREYLDRMNSYDYTISYAQAIQTYGQSFNSSSNEAVENGSVSLGSYSAVIWITGEESGVDHTFSATEQSRIQTYLSGTGKNLFVSGAEIGYDLVYLGNGATFYNSYLKADYAGDDSATYNAAGSAGIFAGLGTITYDNGTYIYDVDYPDQLSISGGSSVNMTYSGGSAGNAGIQFSGTYKLVNLGFPWEAIVSSSQRQDVMTRVLNFFLFTGVDNWTLY